MEKRKMIIVLLCVSLALVLISVIGASVIQTQVGKIRITDTTIPMPNGDSLNVLIYKPANATPKTPAPCVITTHGYYNSKEMQDITAIELARRGFVVFDYDLLYHGGSSAGLQPYMYNREFYAMGMLDLINFVHDNINYIDKNKIGITGHSTGGRAVSYTLDAYGRNAKIAAGIKEGAHYDKEPVDAGIYKTKIASALIVANVPVPYLLENIPQGINVGISMGFYDEGAPMQVTKMDGYFWSDFSVSPQLKNFINLAHPNTFKLDKTVDYNTKNGKPDIKLGKGDVNEKIAIGKPYGDVSKGNLRIVYNPKEFHPWNHFSNESSGIMTDYFTMTLGAPNPLPANNQSWRTKEFFNLLGMLGFMIFLVPFTLILLETPLFASLKNEPPPKLPALTTGAKKVGFALNIIIGAAIPAIILMPVMLQNLKVFPPAGVSNFFPQPATNQIILWITAVALISLALFFVNYYVFGKKDGVQPSQWGLKIGWPNLVKTVFLAAIVVVTAYQLLDWADFFFKTDFRFWTIAIKKFDSSKVWLMLFHYLPFFVLFFFANGLTINGLNRVAGQKEWVNTFFSWLQVLGGIIVVIAIQYGVLISTGEAVWHPNLSWICILLTFPMVLQLTLSTITARLFFDKTGNIYLAAFINAIFIAMMAVANTCTMTILTY